ncbi:MAG: bifunctional proline dehydrogenase/L-glutamate gamma-semialdehyde dehydrogenase PutA, partial [Pseudomonadota bacterium]
GEGARTFEDAERYFANYKNALEELAANKNAVSKKHGISVKLSALHPRFEYLHREDCVPALTEKLELLCGIAAKNKLTLTIDSEEVARIYPTLQIFENLLQNADLEGWQGLGMVVQAYHKAAPDLINLLVKKARQYDRKIQIRLVKGAYWDSEIKHAQIEGHKNYPVYTRKENTDLSYLVCAQKLLELRDILYPMFGTHNAHTVATILDMAPDKKGYEFQKLYGMGDALFNHLNKKDSSIPVCVYAPVGPHEDLLPYLVRRMLENGANSSFVNQIYKKDIAVEDIVQDFVSVIRIRESHTHPKIPLPSNIYGAGRKNSEGLNFDDPTEMESFAQNQSLMRLDKKKTTSIVNGKEVTKGTNEPTINPALNENIGEVVTFPKDKIDDVFQTAETGHKILSALTTEQRAKILEKIADQLENNRDKLIHLCVTEAGRTVQDADSEVREAIDFCRYYAMRGRQDFVEKGRALISPTGEKNLYHLTGRGIFVCISPWNFPIAIFTGQIVAALMAGNAVIAKPAEQTPMTAHAVIKIMLSAGLPKQALSLVLGDGDVGAMLVDHPKVDGVAFTGSTRAAKAINKSLADREGAIPQLIAETGGQNAMIVDSSALTEQVVDDVINSAFGSAGQRCSACRVLFLQDDIADQTINMIAGAMQSLKVGDPKNLDTDVGPLIDEESQMRLQHHKTKLDGYGQKIAQAPLTPEQKAKGCFFAPVAYEIPNLQYLDREHFGPILHVIRYAAKDIDTVLQEINETGYGLTFGVHSRIQSFINHVVDHINVGNVYVNKSTIGAVVGVQPFGGRGLSGTGPKAGGPQYLRAFATEKVVSTDITASGGNTSLVMLGD